VEPGPHLVFGRNHKQVVKKKTFLSPKDKKDWLEFTKQPINLTDKDYIVEKQNIIGETKKLDLHGFTLDQANKKVREFITESFQDGIRKIVVITGKGLRSKVENDPYRSKKMNILKNSIPEYIKNNIDLNNKISKISKADLKDGGEGALYIFLKNIKG
jgi:DNA-nicking Smr family endonuclease|tara:strand:- start:245 stop:718 length:474 start_codon:yes stop_codon:yes gene_type:complete